MQSLSHWLGCVGDFFSGLFALGSEPPALPDGEPDSPGQELHIELSDLPEVPPTTLTPAAPSVAAPAIPTGAWWLEDSTPLTESLITNLSRRLQAVGNRTPRDRILLASHRGQQGAEIRRGERNWFTGNRSTLRNRCYVVLLGGNGEPPFFTWDLSIHQRAVRTGPGGTFSDRAISHGFASLAEAVAFSLGAGLPGLPRTL